VTHGTGQGKKAELSSWTVSRSRSRDRNGWHIQARTADQLSSFATVVYGTAINLLRTKTADGSGDCFTLVPLDLTSEDHVTFNVVGRIQYVGDWVTEMQA
jgi:hypothetical protein